MNVINELTFGSNKYKIGINNNAQFQTLRVPNFQNMKANTTHLKLKSIRYEIKNYVCVYTTGEAWSAKILVSSKFDLDMLDSKGTDTVPFESNMSRSNLLETKIFALQASPVVYTQT